MHTLAHIINQSPPLLGQRNGPAYKRPQRMGPEEAGPLPEGTEQNRIDGCTAATASSAVGHFINAT